MNSKKESLKVFISWTVIALAFTVLAIAVGIIAESIFSPKPTRSDYIAAQRIVNHASRYTKPASATTHTTYGEDKEVDEPAENSVSEESKTYAIRPYDAFGPIVLKSFKARIEVLKKLIADVPAEVRLRATDATPTPKPSNTKKLVF